MTTNQTRLEACIMAYNDAQFIDKTLTSLHNTIRDLDGVYIFDGAWKHGGNTSKSTDNTKGICESFGRCQEYYPVIWHEPNTMYESESAKRNFALEYIEADAGEDVIVLVIDADEVFRFYNGLEEIYLKPFVDMDALGIVDVFAAMSREKMYTPRLIPLGQGIHYHTKRSMILHSGDCTKKYDYNIAEQFASYYGSQWNLYRIPDLFLVNKWVHRDRERMEQKLEFCKVIESTPKDAVCEYVRAN